ncbi:hypothetical protein RJ639_039900 [Escallonia herrerae]|uniref:Acid phosphatase n=1 Tax=Escallonia herrerae TaxID=1293975 RepID=A0AA89BE39_9ASTE|nr:hypothetical protein RJ639_039900 [Escallonia herrerae]
MFDVWLAKGLAPPVPAVLNLYKKLITLGFKIVFISATSESQRDVRVANLNRAGYYKWEKLILNKCGRREEADRGTTAQVYKTKKRTAVEAAGYRILGNMGDQWSDITGTHVGNRTFKLPNPMFYIS